MASDEINFMDLACILKIAQDTVLEKFGSLINASFFDASNIAGTLKQKGLIDFTSNYPGPNGMVLTDAGKNLINEANTRSTEPFDNLDGTILTQLSGGKRLPNELSTTLNLRPKDLALRLYKLYKQEYMTYELKNGSVDMMLTEKGFLKMQTATPLQQTSSEGLNQPKPHGKVEPKDHNKLQADEEAAIKEALAKSKPKGRARNIAISVILLIIIIVLFLYKLGII
jgi:hypothetical protein